MSGACWWAYRKELPYPDSHWQKILEQCKMNISILPCILSAWYNSPWMVCWQAYTLYSSIPAEMSDFLRPTGGHRGNLRSGPILAVLIHSLYAAGIGNTEGEKGSRSFFYDVIAVWAKWGPVSWMAGKAGLLWSTVFFWQIYNAYSIGNGERSFPQREAYFF